MKKNTIIIYVLLMVMSLPTIFAQDCNSRDNLREARRKARDFRRKGYEVTETTWTLIQAISEHNCKKRLGYTELAVNSEGTTKHLGSFGAEVRSGEVFATQKGRFVEGKLYSYYSNNNTKTRTQDIDRWIGMFRSSVATRISGELQFSFALQKMNRGKYEYQKYYLVETAKVNKALKEANHEASERVGNDQEIIKIIDDAIDEKYPIND